MQWRGYERVSGMAGNNGLYGLGTVGGGRQDPKRGLADDYHSEGGGATVAWCVLAFSTAGHSRRPSTGGCSSIPCIC